LLPKAKLSVGICPAKPSSEISNIIVHRLIAHIEFFQKVLSRADDQDFMTEYISIKMCYLSIPSLAADIHFSAVLIFSERSLWFRVATSLK
jgi:hypothetical protein